MTKKMTNNNYQIEAFWDTEVGVWVATSDDVPGLATEAKTMEILTAKIKQMIPELLIANEVINPNYQGIIKFEIITHRQELITVGN